MRPCTRCTLYVCTFMCAVTNVVLAAHYSSRKQLWLENPKERVSMFHGHPSTPAVPCLLFLQLFTLGECYCWLINLISWSGSSMVLWARPLNTVVVWHCVGLFWKWIPEKLENILHTRTPLPLSSHKVSSSIGILWTKTEHRYDNFTSMTPLALKYLYYSLNEEYF